MNEMNLMMAKKRGSKKKVPAIELPEYVVNQYSRLENYLSHSMKWTSYEWEYDETDNAYFNQYNTFENQLSTKFPQLKTRNLNVAEWNKVRKLITGRKPRRFSPKFIQEQRVDLDKYRRRYRILKENNRIDQLTELNQMDADISAINVHQSHEEIYRLIVETKKLFAWKSATVAELSEINIIRAEAQNPNGDDFNVNTKAITAITNLRKVNNGIVSMLEILLHYQIVKDALLFDAMNRKKIMMTLSPDYFRYKSDVRIFESHQDCRSNTFIESDDCINLLNILFAQVLTFSDSEYLAENVVEFAGKLIEEHQIKLKQILNAENFQFFQSICLPRLMDIVQKVEKLSI